MNFDRPQVVTKKFLNVLSENFAKKIFTKALCNSENYGKANTKNTYYYFVLS